MKKRFIPDYIYKNIYEIDYDRLKNNRIKALIFDIDNTLVPYAAEKPDRELSDFLREKSERGFEICLFSNNDEKRVALFNEELKFISYADAKKPLKKNFKHILKRLNLKSSEIAVIGDQIFTDVWAANRMGMTSILVEPIGADINNFFKIKRRLEKRYIKKYEKIKSGEKSGG